MRLGGAMRLGERRPFLERAHPHTSATSANTRSALPHAVHTPTEGARSDSIDARSGSLAGTHRLQLALAGGAALLLISVAEATERGK